MLSLCIHLLLALFLDILALEGEYNMLAENVGVQLLIQAI
jgi:hypothetical protein